MKALCHFRRWEITADSYADKREARPIEYGARYISATIIGEETEFSLKAEGLFM
jgi:hypothetical protein